jgi:predicted HicB family RNase H-like nuclease
MRKLGDRARLTLRMPEGLARKLDRIAQEKGISLNAYLTLCFEKELNIPSALPKRGELNN